MSNPVDQPEIVKAIRTFSLQNALEYEGSGEMKSVLGRIFGAYPNLKPHARDLVSRIIPAVEEANDLAKKHGLEHIRNLLSEEAPEALEKRIKERPLETNEKIVLRFAPNPNGPMTLGHSRGVVINSEYARMYDGEVILRFDDTDTKRKPPEISAYQQIQDEFEWLTGNKANRIIIASDRMPVYLENAEQDIENGIAYVCTCSAEEFKIKRDSKEACPCRTIEPHENKERWKIMNDPNGGWEDGAAVVRIKTDLDLPNPALRDWPALRIQTTAHPRVGSKYRVWPLLDYQSAIEDHLQGVTHIIRGKDLMDSTRKQSLLYSMRGWTYPETMYWGRVKVHEFGGFSTSGMKSDILSGKYSGWGDPRLPTMAALQARGFTAEALRSFWIELGLTQKDISVSMQSIESHNSKIIEKITPRISYVREKQSNFQLVMDEKWPEDNLRISRHPDDSDMGERIWPAPINGDIIIMENEDICPEFRLKEFANVGLIENKLHVNEFERTDRRPIVHWLIERHARPASLFTPKGDEITHDNGLIENGDYSVGDILQLERIGFARITEINTKGDITLIYLHE
jgi:glutamyl-tRNA synthetase